MSVSTAADRTGAALSPRLREVFLAVTRSEWTKLRSVRSTMWALLFTFVSTISLGALLTLFEVSRWDQRTATDIRNFDPLLYSFAGINLAQLSIGVLGVLVMTSEYATGEIRLTFGAVPQRRLVLAAKVATFSTVVAAVSLVSCFLAFLICQPILATKHAEVSLTDAGVLRAVVGGGVHLVLIGAVAIGVGAMVRRTAGAVAVLFAILLVVPGLVTLLPSPWNNDVTKFLPSSAGVAMSALVRFPNLLSPAAGFMVLCGYATATLTVAGWLLVRRDA